MTTSVRGSHRIFSGFSWGGHATPAWRSDFRPRRAAGPARTRGGPSVAKSVRAPQDADRPASPGPVEERTAQHLWPATFVSEANLASLIAEIREALGDTARQPQFIRTVHRFGYAFSGRAARERATHVSAHSSPGHEHDPSNEPAAFCWLLKDGKRVPLVPGENILGREVGWRRHLDRFADCLPPSRAHLDFSEVRLARGSREQERNVSAGGVGDDGRRPQRRRRNPYRRGRAAVSDGVSIADGDMDQT